MKNLTSLLVILFFTQSVFSQESAENTISLGYGTSYMMRQDLIISPFIHKDLSPVSASFSYERSKNLIQKAELYFNSYKYSVIDSYEFFWEEGEADNSYAHSYTFVDLNYYIGKKKTFSDKFSLNYGLASVNKIQAASHIWIWADIFGYFANFGLNTWAEVDYNLSEKSRLKGSISFPVFSFTGRSPYLVNDADHLENTLSNKPIPTFFAYIADCDLKTWNKLQNVDLKIQYEYNLSEKLSLGAKYSFEFISYSEPIKLTSFRNTIHANLKYKF